MTILIAEDNAGVRRLLRQSLITLSTNICECLDGAEAVALYAAQRPDLVLMDIRMPNMDGLEATKRIRKLHSEARIVIVTDYDDEELRDAAKRAGASGYALKHNLTNLLPLLRDVMNA